jgi:hypothetical protein
MKTYAFIAGIAAIGIVAGIFILQPRSTVGPDGSVCTADAKLCPDGSYVGRTGPSCEFSACPTSSATTTPATATTTPATSGGSVSRSAHFGQEVTGNGVRITPLSLLEDSRCPSGVQCIQAGTVRIRATLVSALGTGPHEFKLGQTVTTEAETITLTSVSPQKVAGVALQNSDYVFTFDITKRTSGATGIAPYTSGVQGHVSLGPTCPVERDPPEPECADRPYATTIVVHRTGSPSVFATVESSVTGSFKTSLPPGSYTLAASGGSVLPRCSPVDITVAPSGYVTADISCDTGIR